MKKRLKLNSLALAVTAGLIMGTTVYAGSGGSDGGGGCTVHIGNQTQLLDFAIHKAPMDRTPGVLLKPSPVARTMGIDILSNEENQKLGTLRSWVTDRAALWEKSSPILVKKIKNNIAQFPIYVSPFRFLKLEPSCPLRGQFTKDQLQLAAAYGQGAGILLSIPAFNELTFVNQAGLLLHETFRFMQVQLKEEFSDEAIQDLTYAINFLPANSQNLDMIAYPQSQKDSLRNEKHLDTVTKACHESLKTAGLNQSLDQSLCEISESNLIEKLQNLSQILFEKRISLLNEGNLEQAKKLNSVGVKIDFLIMSYNEKKLNALDAGLEIASSALFVESGANANILFSMTESELKRNLNSNEMKNRINRIKTEWQKAIQRGEVSNQDGLFEESL